MRKLRGAVLGCGLIAEFHLRGWQRLPEVEIVAVADPDPVAVADRRARFAPAARGYAGLAELLAAEPDLDFVDVLTPPALHAGHCRAGRAAGLHVICQKPLCEDLAEARALVADFADGGPLLCVHENHAYRPWFRKLAQRQAEGFFGTVRQFHLRQHDVAAPPQHLNREAARGVLLQYGVHFVDLVRHVLGSPRTVAAQLRRIHPAVRGESAARVTFSYPEASATLDVAWTNGGPAEGEVTLRGDRGAADYEGTMIRGGASRFRLRRGTEVVVDEARNATDDYVAAFGAFEQAFADALLRGAPAPQPAAENLQTLAMTFAAYAAAERGAPVDFAEFAERTALTGGQRT